MSCDHGVPIAGILIFLLSSLLTKETRKVYGLHKDELVLAIDVKLYNVISPSNQGCSYEMD